MANSNKKQRCFKLILLGDSGVGKTSVVNQFTSGLFQKCYSATVGTDFFDKEIEVNGTTVTLQIWDTAGQERFQSLGNWFYRGTDCCILMYDVTRPNTLSSLDRWKDDFLVSVEPKDPLGFPFIVVGNKTDLMEDGNDGCLYKKSKNNFDDPEIPSFLTSAKDYNSVHLIFKTAAEKIIQREIEKDYEVIRSDEVNLLSKSDYSNLQNCCQS